MYSCGICLQHLPHQTCRLQRKIAQIEKWALPMLCCYPLRSSLWLEKVLEERSSQEAEPEASEAKSKECDDGGSKARGSDLLHFCFVLLTETSSFFFFLALKRSFIVWHFTETVKLLLKQLFLPSHSKRCLIYKLGRRNNLKGAVMCRIDVPTPHPLS